MAHAAHDKRQKILRAALKRFAEQGYAGTSVQEIVDAARVTKPTLYYYFRNKADLYGALVDWAMEERYRLMQEAAARGQTLTSRLTAIGASLFQFIQKNRALMRMAFATAFAAPGEVPRQARCLELARRNLEFIRQLMQEAMRIGELDGRFDGHELAMGFAGIMNLYVMAYLVEGRQRLTRRTAERMVQLFLAGAQVS